MILFPIKFNFLNIYIYIRFSTTGTYLSTAFICDIDTRLLLVFRIICPHPTDDLYFRCLIDPHTYH